LAKAGSTELAFRSNIGHNDGKLRSLLFHSTIDSNQGASIFMTMALAWGHIAFDEGGLVELEWRQAACGVADEYFRSWISARLIEDKIRLYADRCHSHTKKAVRLMGVPHRDQKYIFLAVSSEASAIFSDDIDMYEPRAKRWSQGKRAAIKEHGSGCVCIWLWKNYRARICPLARGRDFFDAASRS
jgi:hypothetical protein